MKQRIAIGLISLIAAAATAAETVREQGVVTDVVLYRGQALVTRTVPVAANPGGVELTVTDLPQAIVGSSLFVSSGKDIQVRAVRYHTRATSKAPEKEVQELDDKIAGAERQLRENDRMQQLVSEKLSYLSKLENFVAPTANIEMTKGVLDADTLAKVTNINFEKRSVLAQEKLHLGEQAIDLRKELDLLQRKRRELSNSYSKTEHEAILYLDKAGNGKSELRLNYIVSDASWSPTYNLRGSISRTTADVEVGALVSQTSGEDWQGVDLTLSTAGAQMVADGPTLAPLVLSLSREAQGYGGAANLEKHLKSAQSQLRSNYQGQQSVADQFGNASFQWGMNKAAQEFQQIELAIDPRDIQTIHKTMGKRGSGLAVNYRIGGKVSLASRRDNQMVQITKLSLPATFFYEATPLLTEQVYRYAELTNQSTTSLLEGRASIYLDGEFMGTANLPMVASGQRVIVGYGTNPQLRAWREFVSKVERDKLLGSDKEVTYTYRLVLDNYSDKPIAVRVIDRMPMENEAVRVTLGELKAPLSEDSQYVRIYKPQGLLRWDVEVPAKAARDTAKIIDYSFMLRFNAKLNIAPLAPPSPSSEAKIQFDKNIQLRKAAF